MAKIFYAVKTENIPFHAEQLLNKGNLALSLKINLRNSRPNTRAPNKKERSQTVPQITKRLSINLFLNLNILT
jgi:hypothetical protein